MLKSMVNLKNINKVEKIIINTIILFFLDFFIQIDFT